MMHKTKNHPIDYSLNCEICFYRAENMAILLEHKKKCHDRPIVYGCEFCVEGFPTKQELAQHFTTHVDALESEEEDDEEDVNDPDDMDTKEANQVDHLDTLENEEEEDVEDIDDPDEEVGHDVQVWKKKKRYCCCHCNKEYKYITPFKKHQLAKHSDSKTYFCRLCAKTCKSFKALRHHLRKKHPSDNNNHSKSSCLIKPINQLKKYKRVKKKINYGLKRSVL